MNSLTRTLVYNAHPASLIIGVGAVMSGLTASVIRGGISVFPAIMTLLFMIFMQISANLYHGYFDLCYHAGENIGGMSDRDSRASNSARVNLMRIVANGFGLLAVTTGLALFAFIGWLGVGYFALIMLILFIYFAGPKPLVRTPWSIIVTFLLFGPIAVSGTAVIQNSDSDVWLPVIVYSVINGLLAANAHIAIMYLRYDEDKTNGKHTLVTKFGGQVARFVYLINDVIVCVILIVRPTAVDFVSPWVGIIVAICLFISAIWGFSLMHRDPTSVSRKIRSITMDQYVLVIIVLMAIVMFSIDHFKLNILHLV